MTLGEKQLRNTNQRRLVKQITLERHDHPTADEIYADVRRLDPHISRGTVYRNLNTLAELGEIRRLSMPIGPDRFDYRIDNHYHFCCRTCGRVVDLDMPYNEALNRPPAGLPGYRTEWHRLVLVGVCNKCSGEEKG